MLLCVRVRYEKRRVICTICLVSTSTLLLIIFVYKYIHFHLTHHKPNNYYYYCTHYFALSLIVWPPIRVAEGSPPWGSESPTRSGLPTPPQLLSLPGIHSFSSSLSFPSFYFVFNCCYDCFSLPELIL